MKAKAWVYLCYIVFTRIASLSIFLFCLWRELLRPASFCYTNFASLSSLPFRPLTAGIASTSSTDDDNFCSTVPTRGDCSVVTQWAAAVKTRFEIPSDHAHVLFALFSGRNFLDQTTTFSAEWGALKGAMQTKYNFVLVERFLVLQCPQRLSGGKRRFIH